MRPGRYKRVPISPGSLWRVSTAEDGTFVMMVVSKTDGPYPGHWDVLFKGEIIKNFWEENIYGLFDPILDTKENNG
jgi:hypothetical protein